MEPEAQKPIPDVLYKYRSLSGESRKYVRQTIVENKVYFSSPAKFNDPFDCRVHMTFGGSNRAWKKNFMAFLKKHRPDLNRQQRQAEVHRIVNTGRLRNPEVLQRMIADMQKAVDGLGVFSLSARNDDILMWSYYAEHHAGLCLGFLHRVGPLGPALPVEYSSTYPKLNYLKDDERRMMEANLLTKSASWKHEDEWRIVDWSQGSGLRRYPSELLSEIIFGARMSQEDRDEVLSWLKERNPKPRVLEARLKAGEYGLELRER